MAWMDGMDDPCLFFEGVVSLVFNLGWGNEWASKGQGLVLGMKWGSLFMTRT